MCLAVPGRIIALAYEHDMLMGTVEFGAIRRSVCLELVPEVQPGDYVLVHVGFALTRLDEGAAQEALALAAELTDDPRAPAERQQ